MKGVSILTGSVQVKSGKFYCVLNFKDKDGKRKPKWISTGLAIKGNKRRAEAKLNELLAQYSDSTFIEPTKTLLCDFISDWVKASKCNLQVTTYDNYVHMLNKHIYPYFKDLGITVHQLKPNDIQRYYTTKIDGGLSPNTLIKHHGIMRTALQSAVKQGIIKENVADLVDKPKKQRYISEYYNRDEINQLFSVVKGTPIETPVLLTSYFGLRRSEALGLMWNCVDFVNNTISIKHKVVRAKINGKLKFLQTDDLKTLSSYRTLPLESQIADYLIRLKNKQEEQQHSLGDGYIQDFKEYICVNEIGDLLKPDYVSAKFGKVIGRAGLKHIRFHDLRHSCASLLLALGYNMKDIQEWLGHSNFQTTANIYAHVDPKNRRSMVSGISNVLSL